MNPIYENIKKYLQTLDNPVVFELGVHWAEHTQHIINWCKNKPIYYGFEPDSRNIVKIKQKIKNGLQINLIEGAISNKEIVTELYQSSGIHHRSGNLMTGASSIREPYEVLKRHSWISFKDTIQVRTHTIDKFCEKNNIDRIDFIWSDIQGCEYDMLLGATKMLDNIGLMLLEYSEIELYKGQGNLTQIIDLLGDKWEMIGKDNCDILLKRK